MILTSNKSSSPALEAQDPVIGAETISQNNVRGNAGKETGAFLVPAGTITSPERLFLCFLVSGFYWALRYSGGGCQGDAREDGCDVFSGFRQREN